MSNNKIISYKINELRNQIASNNINAVNDFWTRIEKEGTPLIEEIQGDKDNVLVTFVYKETEPIENVLVFGTIPGYRYSENLMEKLLNTDVWFKTYKVRNDVKFKYNLYLNYQVGKKNIYKDSILDPLNPNIISFIKDEEDPESEEYVYSFVKLANVKPDRWTIPNENVKKGNIVLNRFHSEILDNTRRIWSYTPYGYTKEDTPYNLLVLTDGFDYINWLESQTVFDNLIDGMKIPPTVCVLIETGKNRNEDLSCSEAFSEFLSTEVMPWVYENYNVTKNPHETVIGGVSLGGLAATYIALKNSNIFGNVLSQSGSYWYEEQWLTKEYEKAEKLPINFYLNAGVLEDRPYDSEPIMMEVINNMRDVLLSKGYNVKYENFYSGHDYLSWGETLATGLIALIGKSDKS
ncbi:MAG: alpha/beta hydrolase-fold protein [Clostridium sp.]|nr:alpha/beta hydrolase-fold protein [Clostridium sp.]MDU7083817.1 alpha/beta hydrolase-fold protein [Clostridium sp.]